ncbi:MAG TPA: VWA domain-containing protein [Actinomycetota bacterium]|nr:VWA domain-containing protein [Actinomycetota bacterium]
MLTRMLEFSRAMRDAGVPVAVSENLDALRALAYVPSEDREAFKAALAATMVKSEAHRKAFDTLFDLYWRTGRGTGAVEEQEQRDAPPGGSDPDQMQQEYMEDLFRTLLGGDASSIREAARMAVSRFGRVEAAQSGSPYFQYRVFRAVDLDSLLARLMQEVADGRELTPLEERMWRDEFEQRLREFRQEVEADVRRRLAEHRGAAQVAKHTVRPLPEDLDFVRATRDEIVELRRAIRPLARRLATRLAMKRRAAHRGRLDVRATVRHSLSTGGVPFDTRYRHKTPHRPELFMVCDISGSVAAFARFTLMFVHAFQAQFSRVRSFVFVDHLDEVTHMFAGEDFLAAVDRMNQEADVVRFDGHSDYGNSLEAFWREYGSSIGPRTSVVILGDARNNYRASASWVVKAIAQKARRVYWLNPEPINYWDTGDSIAADYARHASGMFEVRNLRQLEEFIGRVI